MSDQAKWNIGLGAVLLGAVIVYSAARWLEPDPRGYGTHESIGLPPCGLKLFTDLPCPSCGLTTSFAHSARLEVGPALQAHPIGPVLFASVMVGGILSAASLAWRVPHDRLDRWLRLFPWWPTAIAFFTIFFLQWGYRVLKTLTSA